MAHVRYNPGMHEDYAWIIRGVVYRCKLSVIDWGDDVEGRERFSITVHALENSYHKNTAYSMVGELAYNGISVKEAWDEVETYVGPTEMPDKLKQLQPFIAQQANR